MMQIWAIGEVVDGKPTRLTLELATLARQLADAAGAEAHTLLVGPGVAAAADAVAAHGTGVIAVEPPEASGPAAAVTASVLLPLIAERNPDLLLIGATPDGKDLAGALIGLTDLPILVNGSGVMWSDGGPDVEMSVYGGRLTTHSQFLTPRGIVLVRPSSMTAQVAAAPGAVEKASVSATALPAVTVTERVAKEGAGASIEEARVIVGGGVALPARRALPSLEPWRMRWGVP